MARQALAAGPLLDRCFQSAVGAGKRVRRETDFGAGAVSVSSAAVELASKIFADLSERRALLLGAGANGELTARILADRGIGELWIANRTPERARVLAETLGGVAVGFDRLDEVLEKADIVITSTGSDRPIIDRVRMERVMKRRGSRPIALIDIAVPRDIDPAVARLDHCFLTNIDDLTRIIDQNQANRERHIGHARRVIEDEVDRFGRWFAALALGPVIRGLHDRFDGFLRRAVELEPGRFSDEEWPRVEEFTRSLLRKILHGPTTVLRERGSDGLPDPNRVRAVRELFGLQAEEEPATTRPASGGERGNESRIPDRDPK
jgi:glutamyl-tRNA reductase